MNIVELYPSYRLERKCQHRERRSSAREYVAAVLALAPSDIVLHNANASVLAVELDTAAHIGIVAAIFSLLVFHARQKVEVRSCRQARISVLQSVFQEFTVISLVSEVSEQRHMAPKRSLNVGAPPSLHHRSVGIDLHIASQQRCDTKFECAVIILECRLPQRHVPSLSVLG